MNTKIKLFTEDGRYYRLAPMVSTRSRQVIKDYLASSAIYFVAKGIEHLALGEHIASTDYFRRAAMLANRLKQKAK